MFDNPKKKIILQRWLDIIMLILILFLYNKYIVSMILHEIIGSVILIIMVIHIVLNFKAICGMKRNYNKIPSAMKIGLLIDIMLFIDFIALGISGIMISKKLFYMISCGGQMAEVIHCFTGALSIILLGIHIGLHIYYKKIPVLIAVAITISSLILGVCGVEQSRFKDWLAMPFVVASSQDIYNHMNGDIGEYESYGYPEKINSQKENHIGEGRNKGMGKGQGKGYQIRNNISLIDKLISLIQNLGMIFSFTMITYWIVKSTQYIKTFVRNFNFADKK